MNNRNNTGQRGVPLSGIDLMIKGDRAEYHVKRHVEKLQKHPFDCGIDLYPHGRYDVTRHGSWIKYNVPTGVHMVFPPNSYGVIVERSSTIDKLVGGRVATAIIDAGYTGELKVRIMCLEIDTLMVGNAIDELIACELAIAQIIPSLFFYPQFMQYDPLHPLVQHGRGDHGYGSTDKRPVS